VNSNHPKAQGARALRGGGGDAIFRRYFEVPAGWLAGLARLTTALGRVLYSLRIVRYTNRVFGAAELQLLAAFDKLNTHLHVEFTPQFEKCARIARESGLGRG
jgi:hypothetical protein